MPAISPQKLNITAYLYASVEAAEEGAPTGGSGFLLGVPASTGQGHFVYAVTNRHVVDAGNHVLRVATRDGHTAVVPIAPEAWTTSADDDLAVADFPPAGEGRFSYVTTDEFLDEGCLIEGWPVFPGDDVVLFGRLIAHDGRQRNTPVMRFGNVAMLADAGSPVRVGELDQEAFLVEARSLSGFSGAPAYVHLAQPRWMASADDKSGWIPSTLRFLGVNCAHLPMWTPVLGAKDRNVRISDMWVESNSGMAVVIPAWRLLALVNQDHLVAERERQLRSILR